MLRVLLALTLLQATPAAPADTTGQAHQAAPAASERKPDPGPVPADSAAREKPARTQPASVSDRLFSPRWVLFPARVVLVTILLALGLLAGSGGAWLAYRMAHSLRHTKWREPPRRLKRGEIGAAGASVALEWEDRIERNENQDAERDRQIATLQETVARLTERLETLTEMVELLRGHVFGAREANDD